MRIILLNCLVLLFIGNNCHAQYSYIPQMPNEPAYTNAGQLKIGGTIGFNHYESQAAFSPIKHLTLLADYFKGFGNQWSTEYGGSIYQGFKLRKKKIYFSIGYTIGEGNIKAEELIEKNWQGTSYQSRNCYYHTQNIQAALYYLYDEEHPKQMIGILFKRTQIQYNYLYKDYTHKNYVGTIDNINSYFLGENLTMLGHYIMLFGHAESNKNPFYLNWQIGLKPMSGVTELAEMNKTGNPLGGSLALNLAGGINLDFY